MARALLTALGAGAAALLASLAGCQLLFPIPAAEEQSGDSGLRDGAAVGDGGTIVVEAPDADVVRCVAADDTNLYWSDQTAMTLMQSALDGSRPTTLLMAVDVSEMFLAGTKLYYYGTYSTNSGLHVLDLVAHTNQFLSPDIQGCVWVTATAAYSVNVVTSVVYRIDPSSGAATQLLGPNDGINGPWGVAADDTHLYWTNRDPTYGGTVLRQLIDGGSNAQQERLATQQSRPQCLTLDGTGLLYWANFDDGTIHRAQVDGGGQMLIAQQQTQPTQIAVTTQFVFWNSGNHVVRNPR
jgi:hypothetical protein